MAYDSKYEAADAARRAYRPFVLFQDSRGRWDYRDATPEETHSPATCKAKGMFGANCPLCRRDHDHA